MDKSVKIYLVWEEKTDPSGTCRMRVFPNYNLLNDFLLALDGNNIKAVKVIAGMLLEDREELLCTKGYNGRIVIQVGDKYLINIGNRYELLDINKPYKYLDTFIEDAEDKDIYSLWYDTEIL